MFTQKFTECLAERDEFKRIRYWNEDQNEVKKINPFIAVIKM